MIEAIKKEWVAYFGRMAQLQTMGIVSWVNELER